MIDNNNINADLPKLDRKNVLRAWLVVAGCCILLIGQTSFGTNTLSLYLVPVTQELGISRVTFSLTFTFLSGIGVPLALIAGALIKKLGLFKLVAIGLVFAGIGYFLLSMATASTPWMFPLGGAIYGIATVFAGMVMTQNFIGSWFIKHRSLAVGITTAVMGLGTMVASPLIAGWINTYGWSTAFQINAIAVLGFPLIALIFLRNSPEKMGMRPIGYYEHMKSQEASASTELEGIDSTTARKTLSFWLLLIAVILMSIVTQTVLTQQSAMIMDKGFSLTDAATILSIYALVNTLNKLLAGWVSDKFGFRVAATYIVIASIVAMMLMAYAYTFNSMIVFAICFGTWPSISALYTISTVPAVFGRRDFPKINTWLFSGVSGGGLLGPLVVSSLYEFQGNYIGGLWLASVFAIIILSIAFFVLRKKNLFDPAKHMQATASN